MSQSEPRPAGAVASSTERPSSNHIAIAGGGLIGMSIAWRLAQQGWPVTIFDKGSIGGEASWAGAGMLAPGGEVEGPSALAAFSLESRRLYAPFVHEVEQASGIRIDYQECGALDVAYSPEELAALEDRAMRQADLGISSKPLTAAQIAAFWPRVRNQGLAGGRFYPEDAIVNPRELVAALKQACIKLGARLLENCPVSHAAIQADRIDMETRCGPDSCHTLVVAAGAWSDSLAVDGVPALPLASPVKGHLIGYQQPDQTCSTIIRHGPVYLLQRANGLLIAGASVEHVGFNRDIDARIVSWLSEEAGSVLPHLQETSPSEKWIGFRPESDALHVGSWHSERLYLAYGHYRNGILLAPVTARDLASQISASLRTR